jgi:hypothetical protein
MQQITAQDENEGRTRGAAAAGLVCLVLAGIAILIDAATLAPGEKLTREGGSVETASALLYLVAAAAFLWREGSWRRLWPVPVLLLAMAAREFDFDKRFTSEGLLGIKILTRETPLWEKALAVLVIALLTAAIAVLVRRGLRGFLEGLRRRRGGALYLLAAVALTAGTKTIDGLARKLAPLGIDVSASTSRAAGSIEEYLELGIPILLLMAILARTPRPKATTT